MKNKKLGLKDVLVIGHLPPLAWIYDAGAETAMVGNAVDVFDQGLFEGCWPGEFQDFDPERSPHIFGSGLKVVDSDVMFLTASHTLESLYYLRTENEFYVSNDLYLLCRLEQFDRSSAHEVTRRLHSSIEGFERATEILAEHGGARLGRIMFFNFRIGESGIERIRKGSAVAGFGSFEVYRDYLVSVVGSCRLNAQASRRKGQYEILCTCSSGYDSNGSAAVGRMAGADSAITIKSDRSGMNDSGRQAAVEIGLRCLERDRPIPGQELSDSAILFLAGGAGAGDFPLSAFKDILPNKILLTGNFGDKIWGRRQPPTSDMARVDSSGASIHSYRLERDFFHIPVPTIAGELQPDVQRISEASEMQPWSVDAYYDRPIPRRLVEELGGQRSSFGIEKKMMAVVSSKGGTPLTNEEAAAFERFIMEQGMARRLRLERMLFRWGNFTFRAVRKLRRFTIGRLAIPERVLTSLKDRFQGSEKGFEANMLWLWAVRELDSFHRSSAESRRKSGVAQSTEDGGVATECP
jgi:hypothetical protein